MITKQFTQQLNKSLYKKIINENDPDTIYAYDREVNDIVRLFFQKQEKGFCSLHAVNNALGGVYITYDLYNAFVEKGIDTMAPNLTLEEKEQLKIKAGWNPAYKNPAPYEFGATDIITEDNKKSISAEKYKTISKLGLQSFLLNTYRIELRRVLVVHASLGYYYILISSPNKDGLRHAVALRNGMLIDSNYAPQVKDDLQDFYQEKLYFQNNDIEEVFKRRMLELGSLTGTIDGAWQLIERKQGETIPDILDDFSRYVQNQPELLKYGHKDSMEGTRQSYKVLPKVKVIYDNSVRPFNHDGETFYPNSKLVGQKTARYFTKKKMVSEPSLSIKPEGWYTNPNPYNLIPKKKFHFEDYEKMVDEHLAKKNKNFIGPLLPPPKKIKLYYIDKK